VRTAGKSVLEERVVRGRKERFVTERDMPPPERPGPRRQEGEQEHLREDAGMTNEGLGPGVEPAEQAEQREDDKSLIDKVKDKLQGS
jgi:hypothetical protein